MVVKRKKTRNYLATEIIPEYSPDYDSAEFSLATGESDYDVKTNQANSFKNVLAAHSIIIRTNYEISVKFNATTNSSVTISRGEGSLTITRDMGFEVENIYITNDSGSTAAIKLFLVP